LTASAEPQKIVLTGVVVVPIGENKYNIPIKVVLEWNYPIAAPSLFVLPTACLIQYTHILSPLTFFMRTLAMYIPQGHPNVDLQGRVALPYLQNWTMGYTLQGLLQQAIAVFSQHPPVHSRPVYNNVMQQPAALSGFAMPVGYGPGMPRMMPGGMMNTARPTMPTGMAMPAMGGMTMPPGMMGGMNMPPGMAAPTMMGQPANMGGMQMGGMNPGAAAMGMGGMQMGVMNPGVAGMMGQRPMGMNAGMNTGMSSGMSAGMGGMAMNTTQVAAKPSPLQLTVCFYLSHMNHCNERMMLHMCFQPEQETAQLREAVLAKVRQRMSEFYAKCQAEFRELTKSASGFPPFLREHVWWFWLGETSTSETLNGSAAAVQTTIRQLQTEKVWPAYKCICLDLWLLFVGCINRSNCNATPTSWRSRTPSSSAGCSSTRPLLMTFPRRSWLSLKIPL